MKIGFISTTISAQNFQITDSQLKQVNLIFAEHEYLLQKDSINEELIFNYENIICNYEEKDSLLTEELKICVEENEENLREIEKSKKKRKVLGGVAGAGWGISICAVILLICL